TWADVVNHSDPEQRRRHILAGTGVDYADGLRASDPQRLAVYFSKHGGSAGGAKEYQNTAPELWEGQSVGRFWGRWNLEKVTAGVDVSPEDFFKVSRTLRRHHDAKGLTRRVRVFRVRRGPDGFPLVDEDGNVRGRWRWQTRRSVRRFSGGSGFVTANDGPAFASQLARSLAPSPIRPHAFQADRIRDYRAWLLLEQDAVDFPASF
ncbi:hypothetical protein, partial [Thermomonospora catenispora]|uniref:hypothetical protein n=1 Tax=Thermomonospora catenispora TaxID=2493090 RepID=UPI0019D5A22D